jgi:hypothetical protein
MTALAWDDHCGGVLPSGIAGAAGGAGTFASGTAGATGGCTGTFASGAAGAAGGTGIAGGGTAFGPEGGIAGSSLCLHPLIASNAMTTKRHVH